MDDAVDVPQPKEGEGLVMIRRPDKLTVSMIIATAFRRYF